MHRDPAFVKVDGVFGPATEARVRAVQALASGAELASVGRGLTLYLVAKDELARLQSGVTKIEAGRMDIEAAA